MARPTEPVARRGQGPDQLPQGAAAATNRAATQARAASAPAPAEPGPAPEATAPTPEPTAPAAPQAPPENFRPNPGDDIEQFLFAPTQNPSQPVTAGLTASSGVAPSPDARNRMAAMLPDLQLAANDPSAPPQTKALLDLIVFHLNQN